MSKIYSAFVLKSKMQSKRLIDTVFFHPKNLIFLNSKVLKDFLFKDEKLYLPKFLLERMFSLVMSFRVTLVGVKITLNEYSGISKVLDSDELIELPSIPSVL